MSVNRSVALVSVALLSVGLLACASAKVAATYDSSVDFSQYRAFAFRADRRLDDPVRQGMVEDVITRELTRKGFRRDDAAPNMLIGISGEAGMDEDSGGYVTGAIVWTTMGPYDGISMAVGRPDTKEVTAALTFRDARDRRLLWKGVFQATAVHGNPSANKKRGEAALKELLAEFPPKKK